MRKYFAVFKVNWQKSFEYRADFFGHVGMGMIAFIVMYFVWSAVFNGRTTFNGYTFSAMMTYVMLTRFLHFVMRGNIGREIASEIKEGKLSVYLIKPFSYLKYWFSIFLANRSFEFLIRFFMLVVSFLLLPGVIVFEGVPRLALFLFFAFLALLINFLINLLMSSFAFWLTDVRLFRSTLMMVIDFLAGAMIPLDVLPWVLKKISFVLPFQYVAYFPIRVYQGAIAPSEMIKNFFFLIAWILVLSYLLKFVWKRGVKHYEAIGQ